MLSVKVAGHWLSSLTSSGPVTVEYGPHGSEMASWEMDPTFRHPLLRGNALVEVFDGGHCVWCGNMVEPGTEGQISARGLWRQGEGVYPMTAAGDLTTNIDAALLGAITTRGELDWSQKTPISNVEWAPDATQAMTLVQLLDGYAAENSLRWWIDPATRSIEMAVDPTTPHWTVPHVVAGRGLAPAEDEFYTHLVGRYLDSATSTNKTTLVGSAEAAATFGRRTVLVDLADLGAIDQARAESVLSGMLLKSGARMGWGEGLELAHGQICTPGGTPAALGQITSLQMVRLAGTVDASRPNLLRSYTDIVLETVKYTDGSRTISVTPFGYAPRNSADAWELAMSDE